MNKIITSLLIIIVLFFCSCKDESTNSVPNDNSPLLGKWQNVTEEDDMDKGLRFDKSDLYLLNDINVPGKNEEEFYAGTYSISSDIVNFHITRNEWDLKGAYKYTISGTTLKFYYSSGDSCMPYTILKKMN